MGQRTGEVKKDKACAVHAESDDAKSTTRRLDDERCCGGDG
jgi:hypothetical protein